MMLFVIVGGIVSLLTAAIGVILALRIQLGALNEKAVEREAWENAQESHQYAWQMQESRASLLFKQQITGRVQQMREKWQQWESRFNDHSKKLSQEYALNSLPRVEETPLSLDGHHHVTYAPPNWQPPTFYEADLRERDFSHRYLGEADFRKAQLSGANFYMADLRGSCLAGANLAGASLVGANLTDADLRGANLSGANMLVADLHDAILYGAHLPGVRNLTPQQLYHASYDHTTQLEPEIDITLTRVPASPTPTENTDHATTPQLIQQGLESSPLSPQASGDNSQDRETAGLPTNKPVNTHTETTGTAIPRIGQNGRKRARVS
jgi:Pentapeptide repeats (8 copies)